MPSAVPSGTSKSTYARPSSIGPNSADFIHLFAEALNLAFADRERYYGDPRFVDVPLDVLLSKEYAARRRTLIDSQRAFGEMPAAGDGSVLTGSIAATGALHPDTSYVCAVDDEGNARGRPGGVAVDRGGALLVADDVGNAVWRVTAAP